MSHPNICSYEALHNFMTYLLHHPHLPILYPLKDLKRYPLKCHFQCGDTEITSLQANQSPSIVVQAYQDRDLGRDLLTRQSVNAGVHELNGVSIMWT